ncbi:MAG: NAD(P)-dependent alcohol dehydrogenase [Planctomycetes bacterium]|nr:NAD(P)-dependent alcohol dehydrogenase [Planctomycetota bacterium]
MQVYEIRAAFGLDHLTPAERPLPEPGPRQVRVRLHALSLNYRDLMMVQGTYNPRLVRPRVPVSDGVGTVVALGAGVQRVRVGDRVAGTFFQGWVDGDLDEAKARTDLGGTRDGLLAEEAVLEEDGVIAVPDHLSDAEAATLPCAALTAWNAVVETGRVAPGGTVLVQGMGGVSTFALLFAKRAGARVVVLSSSPERLDRARALGADEGVDYRREPEWDKRVRALTGGRGVDLVVEVGGAGTLPRSLRAVRMGGTIALIGVLAGAGQVDPLPAVMRQIRLAGIFVGSRAMFERMNAAIALHRLRPVLDRVFPFSQAVAALRHLESGSHFGKIVLALGPGA